MSQKFVRRGPKRPIDKTSEVIVSDAVGTSQVAQELLPITVAQTIIRIVGNIEIHDGAAVGNIGLAIVMKRDGQALSTMLLTSGSRLYAPEQDVLYQYMGKTVAADTPIKLLIDVKGMRKLKPGDSINLVLLGAGADVADVVGQLTLFSKQ